MGLQSANDATLECINRGHDAATFAATGTPAIFVHPGEAGHGDLGMLATGDVLLVLSNSGNTSELRPILN